MGCDPVKNSEGQQIGFACTRSINCCHFCKDRHTKLCDFPLKFGTCDKRMCVNHATSVGEDLDYCPDHAKVNYD